MPKLKFIIHSHYFVIPKLDDLNTKEFGYLEEFFKCFCPYKSQRDPLMFWTPLTFFIKTKAVTFFEYRDIVHESHMRVSK